MLRCGQMVMADALQRIRLGPDWRWLPEGAENEGYRKKYVEYLSIARLVSDAPSSPYGIHRIALTGQSTDESRRPVGTWFGPNTVAQVIRRLAAQDEDNDLSVQVALDNHIILDEIREASADEKTGKWSRPLLLFVPLRLGLTELNPIYFDDLKVR